MHFPAGAGFVGAFLRFLRFCGLQLHSQPTSRASLRAFTTPTCYLGPPRPLPFSGVFAGFAGLAQVNRPRLDMVCGRNNRFCQCTYSNKYVESTVRYGIQTFALFLAKRLIADPRGRPREKCGKSPCPTGGWHHRHQDSVR